MKRTALSSFILNYIFDIVGVVMIFGYSTMRVWFLSFQEMY